MLAETVQLHHAEMITITGKSYRLKHRAAEDLQIQPYVVSRASATRNIFRSAVLKKERYQACVVVEPDAETRAFLDGDVSYYPHQPFRINDEHGGLVQRVTNHRSDYDEKPTTVELPAGQYFVVPESGGAARPRIGVVIKGGEVTRVDVESILQSRRRP